MLKSDKKRSIKGFRRRFGSPSRLLILRQPKSQQE